MTFKIPAGVLAQHTAVLGKTGSGKTSTAKLMVEQVVADGARVCILDPIKSDWWGLISSSDGKRPGLPFQILGGPHGHVPLHNSSGKAIGEIVANGALPLSILDMADFGPGGQAQFFIEFAPTLLRKMRGVVYLVMEEAHLFAPKERSGIGQENMSIHWAKTMATAGRSKGIRLILVTQRTQALHNALLGSCDTMIAHRMTAPADQEPVVKWLKANTSKEITEKVASSISSLATGSGWLCSGEEKLFELVKFPRIHTYDNSATPTGNEALDAVKTAPVDAEKLRAIIGEAVKVAEANDPAALKRKIAELERQAKQQQPAPAAIDPAAADRAYQAGYDAGATQGVDKGFDQGYAAATAAIAGIVQGVVKAGDDFMVQLRAAATAIAEVPKPAAPAHTGATVTRATYVPHIPAPKPGNYLVKTRLLPVTKVPHGANGHDSSLSGVQQRILDALAELEQMGAEQPDRELVAFMAGYSNVTSKGFANAIGSLRTQGMIEYPSTGSITVTDTGREYANPPERARTPTELQDRIIGMLGGASARVLRPLIDAYPKSIDRQSLAEAAGYGNVTSKGFANAIGRFRSLGFIDYPDRGTVVAKPLLFLE